MSFEYFPYIKYTNKEIEALPDKFKSGSVLIDQGDLQMYMGIGLMSCVLCQFWFLILRQLHRTFDLFGSNKKNDEKY